MCMEPGSSVWQYCTPCEDVGKQSRDYRERMNGVTGPICFLAVILTLGAVNTCAYIPALLIIRIISFLLAVKLAQKVNFPFKTDINCQIL